MTYLKSKYFNLWIKNGCNRENGKKITNLSLSKQQRKEIPEELEIMNNLIHLYLGFNHIVKIPPFIKNFNHLVSLDLTKNFINELPDEIGDLIHLEQLIINFNNLKILPDSITRLKKLKVFEAFNNNLIKLPKKFYKLVNLTELNLSCNNLFVKRQYFLLRFPKMKSEKLDISFNTPIIHIKLNGKIYTKIIRLN